MPNYTAILAPSRPHVYARARLRPATVTPLEDGLPERRILAAVITLAVDDLVKRHPHHSFEAKEYIAGENFEHDCLALGMDPDIARERIARYVRRAQEARS